MERCELRAEGTGGQSTINYISQSTQKWWDLLLISEPNFKQGDEHSAMKTGKTRAENLPAGNTN